MVSKKSSKSSNKNDVLIILSPLFVVILVALFSLLYVFGTFSVSSNSYIENTGYSVSSDSSLHGQAVSSLVEDDSDDVFCSELKSLYDIQNKPLDDYYYSQC